MGLYTAQHHPVECICLKNNPESAYLVTKLSGLSCHRLGPHLVLCLPRIAKTSRARSKPIFCKQVLILHQALQNVGCLAAFVFLCELNAAPKRLKFCLFLS